MKKKNIVTTGKKISTKGMSLAEILQQLMDWLANGVSWLNRGSGLLSADKLQKYDDELHLKLRWATKLGTHS